MGSSQALPLGRPLSSQDGPSHPCGAGFRKASALSLTHVAHLWSMRNTHHLCSCVFSSVAAAQGEVDLHDALTIACEGPSETRERLQQVPPWNPTCSSTKRASQDVQTSDCMGGPRLPCSQCGSFSLCPEAVATTTCLYAPQIGIKSSPCVPKAQSSTPSSPEGSPGRPIPSARGEGNAC